MTERDRIIFARGVIYDEMSKALTEKALGRYYNSKL